LKSGRTASTRRHIRRTRRYDASGWTAADIQILEDRTLLSVAVAHNYAALNFTQSGGFVPPDSNGAAGPSSFVESVNQTVAIFSSKTSATPALITPLDTFYFTNGGLPHVSINPLDNIFRSDPIVTYDNLIGRFIVGDQEVDDTSHLSNFLVAVSKTSNPQSLTTADWNFYTISTTEANFDADYPGNFGFNQEAFVFTLNMFPALFGNGHVLVTSVNAADLANGVSQANLHVFHNDVNAFSLRPTAMQDSSLATDPMWLIGEHGDNQSIDVYRMTNVLSNNAGFGITRLFVQPYSSVNFPLNPDGSTVTQLIDSRIMNAAEWNNSIVATHAVGVGPSEDVAQWYQIDVSTGSPHLSQMGRVSAGPNTYIYYPGIEINSMGQIGMSYMKSGTDSPTDFMSMYVTARQTIDPAGTMETPVLVPSGAGQANYTDFDFAQGHRAGDMSGINLDPVNGSFWAVNEYATNDLFSGANWGTAVANFSPGGLSPPANVTGVALTPTTAQISWGLVQGANLGYQIFLVPPSGPDVQVGLAGAGVTTAVATGLAPGASNTIFVRALSSTLPPFIADSATIQVVTPIGLQPPQNVSAFALSPTTAYVSWNTVLGADMGYAVFMVPTAGPNVQVATAPAGATNVVVTGLPAGTTVTLFVRALSSTFFPFVADSAQFQVVMPGALSAPQPVFSNITTTTAVLSWAPVPTADGYRVFEMVNGQEVLVGTFGSLTTSVLIAGLAPGSTTFFMVEAFRGNVISDSNWVSVTTIIPMIQPPIPNVNPGNQPPAFH
jgi:hypothetical protein